jgi:hypothetical protein
VIPILVGALPDDEANPNQEASVDGLQNPYADSFKKVRRNGLNEKRKAKGGI